MVTEAFRLPYFFILSILVLCGTTRVDAVDRPILDDVFYFVLPNRFNNAEPDNDTGGYGGDKFSHGFDPTDKAFYHGGDIKGDGQTGLSAGHGRHRDLDGADLQKQTGSDRRQRHLRRLSRLLDPGFYPDRYPPRH